MNYLVDTNIFLEILLQQKKKENCKEFLNSNIGKLSISDFSLHSIGVILFNKKERELYKKFITDTLPKIKIITNPKDNYEILNENSEKYNLDFDDAYQFTLAEKYNLTIKTMDEDFKNIGSVVEIEFI